MNIQKASCADGDHFVVCDCFASLLPLVGTTFFREHREHHAKPYTRHEVTARRAGAPSGRTHAAS